MLPTHMSVQDLSGDWNGAFIQQTGNQITIEPDWSKIDPATAPWTIGNGTLIGNSLTIVFSGGRATVPVTYYGSVEPDGRRISWSNGTAWTKIG
jgi:hypothetical protein